jgi:Right handed beta helix region
MRRRVSVLLLLAAAALAVALAAPAAAEAKPRAKTIRVANDAQFTAAVRKLRWSGGRIVLRPRLYRRLVIGARGRAPLRIVGTRGARVQHVVFDGAQRVSLGRVRVGPISGDALVEVWRSRDIVLHDLVVGARRTRFSASVLIADGVRITVRRSNFTACGDRARDFVNCLTLYRWSHRVLVEDNVFHDCRGCDFLHGRFGSRLVIRRNSFDRALPCSMGRHRCGHNDLLQLFGGRHVRIEGNRFGVYREGGAQLYLTNWVDYATIVNNVFVGTDPRVPGYHARMGIVIGSNASRRLPHFAKVVNNTILTGTRRRDGYAGSIRMSTRYSRVLRWKRPIVANNVIALLEQPARVCNGSQRFVNNLVLHGRDCSRAPVWHPRPLGLDRLGRPVAGSLVIDSANRFYAPKVDLTGRRRGGAPDIGALEYRGR